MKTSTAILICACLGLVLPAGCGKNVKTNTNSPSALVLERLGNESEPENLIRVTSRIYSGGEPSKASDFETIAKLGIKTVVSVDGARPNVELAEQYGLRYVHIPIGYDGIDQRCSATITKVVREVDGPIYIHCHHGKHRGPAAAAIAAISDGSTSAGEAVSILELAGTSRDYAGLWRDVERFVSSANLDGAGPLLEIAEVDSFIESMAAIGRANDHLTLCEKSDWSTPLNHPDLIPANESLIMLEGFQESLRHLEKTNPYAPGMASEIADAHVLTASLTLALRANDHIAASKTFAAIKDSCKACHRQHRDLGH